MSSVRSTKNTEVKAGERKRRVLHITPHLGGGVGRVLLNYLQLAKEESEFVHEVKSLEYANETAREVSNRAGILIADRMFKDIDGLLAAVAHSDIILFHWWNHPLLYAFLVRECLPPARVIFWSHILGFSAPYVFSKAALCYPDLFVFTSPVSLDAPEVRNLRIERQRRLRTIWSTGGVEEAGRVIPKEHKGFNIGYIGTVDYSKLHPRYIEMSSSIKIPEARFVVCGGPSEKKIERESMACENHMSFEFVGNIKDVWDYLAIFDVFGYPLAPHHYGTCEQVLGECMAAGIPPVVMSNPTECLIVENGVTGIIASNERAYVKGIEELHRNAELRKRLGNNARNAAKERYCLKKMVSRWENVFCEALSIPKRPRAWTGGRRGKRTSPAQIFLESLGGHCREFENSLSSQNIDEKRKSVDDLRALYGSSYLWRAQTHGTPRHYLSFFPEDEQLKLWADLPAIDPEDKIRSRYMKA